MIQACFLGGVIRKCLRKAKHQNEVLSCVRNILLPLVLFVGVPGLSDPVTPCAPFPWHLSVSSWFIFMSSHRL